MFAARAGAERQFFDRSHKPGQPAEPDVAEFWFESLFGGILCRFAESRRRQTGRASELLLCAAPPCALRSLLDETL